MRGMWIVQAVATLLLCLLLVKSLAAQPADKERLMNELDKLVDDDGSIETALMNYLFAKQVVNRLRSQVDVSDLQRKRSYWKQCAFNAVSCFGQKREGGGRGRGLYTPKNHQKWNFFTDLFSF